MPWIFEDVLQPFIEATKRLFRKIARFLKGHDTMSGMPEPSLQLNQELVLEKCDRFMEFQLWPLTAKIDPSLWLENFTSSERILALHLLNSFTYYSDSLVDQLFRASFQNLSAMIDVNIRSTRSVHAEWRQFVDGVIVTYVTGERPNVTDSGFLFARKARQVLGINENRIVSPEEALRQLINFGGRPVIFVDDFVGSGQQFIATWHRDYPIDSGISYSFAKLAAGRKTELFYCPVFCTSYGLQRLQSICPQVKVSAANVLSPRHSALDSHSIVWPPNLRTDAFEFIENASRRAGIPDTDGGENDWRGFHKLGLTLALSHSVPDATLPLFYWEGNGWNPLIRRT